ncbi:unnamed protein product [Sympodiomycopsis kandeliae]
MTPTATGPSTNGSGAGGSPGKISSTSVGDATNLSNSGNSGTTASTSSAPLAISHEEAQARYAALKSQIHSSLAQKRNMDRTLSDLESQIWLFEGSYFAATAASGGNIVKGFDNYLKNTTTSGGRSTSSNAIQAALMDNGEIPPEDRVFSTSSLTYQRSLELKAAEEMAKQANAAAAAAAAKAEKEAKASSSSKASKKNKDKSNSSGDKDKEKDKDDGKKDKEKEKGSKSKDKDKEKDEKEKADKGNKHDKDKDGETKKEAKEKKDKKRRRED